MRANSIKRAHGDRADFALQITEARSAGLVDALREQVGKGQIDAEEIGDHLVVERSNGAKLCLRCSKRADDGELERIDCE